MGLAVICAIIIVSNTIFAEDIGESCTTPNNEIAKCVPTKTCTILSDAIKQNKTGIIEFARQSQCGYDSEPLVCCGTTSSITLLNRSLDTDAFPNRTVCGLDALGLDAPGLDAIGSRIFHGDKTRPNEFPWMAALEYKENETNVGIRCSGSVINERFVLTAAHCIRTPSLELISVWLGEWRISTDPDCEVNGTETICHDAVKKLNVEEKIPHPLYSAVNNYQNDIALLRLEKNIIYTDYIKPICLPDPRSPTPNILTPMIVAGWGKTENGGTSDIKLKAEILLRSNEYCVAQVNTTLTSRQLCAGGADSKDSCYGDSGGPLMRFYQESKSSPPQWFLEGIVSWGAGCGRPDIPAVYTRVSEYYQWIAATVSVRLLPIAVQPNLRMNKDRGEICTTPNNETAKCVPTKTCTILSDAIKQNMTGIKEFALQSQCGYDSEPLVCCGTTSGITLLSKVLETDAVPNRTVCGLDALGGRIIHGEGTNPKEFPWMAALEYNDKLSNTSLGIGCGGSVINKRFVLTAAHCIRTSSLELISVWLGEWRISTDPDCEIYGTERICGDPVQKFNIEEEILHPCFSYRNKENDIGLLLLAKDITYTDYIRPICLPNPESAKPNILTRMTVAGWWTSADEDASDIKLKVEIPLRSKKTCMDKLNKTLTSSQLCAGGEKGKDACKGLPGGPLMRFYQDSRSPVPQWFQEGIVSWDAGCARPDYPAVYTRVSEYVEWIVNIVSVRKR